VSSQENNQNIKSKGIFKLFRSGKKDNSHSCCDVKIVPKEQPEQVSGKGGCCNVKIVSKEQVTDTKSN
jgi:hypothetical protein